MCRLTPHFGIGEVFLRLRDELFELLTRSGQASLAQW